MSAPFKPSAYVAVPFYGSIGDTSGNRILLRCAATGAEISVAEQYVTTEWATAFLRIPAGFCSSDVRLLALATNGHYPLGVGTPFTVTRAEYAAQTGLAARMVIVVGTWAMAVACMFMLAWAGSALPGFYAPAAAGAAGLGAIGMAVFAGFLPSPAIGTPLTFLIAAAIAAVSAALIVHDRARAARVARRYGPGALFWLLVALAYTSLVTAADNGGGGYAINSMFSPARWGMDSQLPVWFAERLFDGFPRDKIQWGTWLASDRTPLLTGILLIPRVILLEPLARSFGSTFVATGYSMAAITVLSIWSAILFWITQAVCRRALPALAVLTVTSPFLFFNTVYIWPKMLGAAFVVLAFALLNEMSARTRMPGGALILVGLCAALAYLSHASNAFALVPLAAFYARTILRQGVLRILLTGAAAVLVGLPWFYFQSRIQPGGNALLRFALTGDFGFDIRGTPILESVKTTYAALGFQGWLAAKTGALTQIFAWDVRRLDSAFWGTAPDMPLRGTDALGILRLEDFFYPQHAIAVALLAAIAVIFARRHLPSLQLSARAGLIGALGLALMFLTTFPTPITHQLAYGSLLLLVFAGALTLASGPSVIAAVACVVSTAYFAIVWVAQPLLLAERLHFHALAGCIASATAAGAVAVWASLTRANQDGVASSAFTPTISRGSAARSIASTAAHFSFGTKKKSQ